MDGDGVVGEDEGGPGRVEEEDVDGGGPRGGEEGGYEGDGEEDVHFVLLVGLPLAVVSLECCKYDETINHEIAAVEDDEMKMRPVLRHD